MQPSAEDKVIYIGPGWTIVKDPDQAVMVKVIKPDGRVIFGIPAASPPGNVITRALNKLFRKENEVTNDK